MSLQLKKVAHAVVELARERVDELLTENGKSRPLRELLVNAYLQGAVDGSTVAQRQGVARGRYKKGAPR